jgi:glycosyltransferase involved in cell wall biosynthesis
MLDSAEGLTVILPVSDCEKTLGKTVAGWLPVLDSLGRPYELLIIDDASQDGTKAQADHIVERNGRIKVLVHPERKGFGACLRTALAVATHPLIFYTSADHDWHPSDLPRMLKSLDFRDEYTGKQVELVNGHRRGTVWPSRQKSFNRIYRALVRVLFGHMPDPPKGWLGPTENRFWWKCRILFGLRVGDVNSKFKLMRRTVLDRIEIQSDGDFVNAEILAKANFLGCMMDEIVLTDRDPPPPAADMSKEMWRVFHDAKFRSPVPTPGIVEEKPDEQPPAAPEESVPAPAT